MGTSYMSKMSVNSVFWGIEIEPEKFRGLLNSRYYEKYKDLFEIYTSIFKDVVRAGSFSSSAVGNRQIDRLRSAYNKSLKGSTYDFFGRASDSLRIKNIRKVIDASIGVNINSSNNAKFNINLYNIGKIIELGSIAEVNYNILRQNTLDNKAQGFMIENVTDDKDKVIIALSNDKNNYSSMIIARHAHSIEVYDIKNRKTIAYKNYATGKCIGGWNFSIEKMCNTAYQMYLDKNSCRVIQDATNKQALEERNKCRGIVINAVKDLSKHGNIKNESDLKLITTDVLGSADINKINEMIKCQDKAGIERYLKELYINSFVRLVDHKKVEPTKERFSSKLIGVYNARKKCPRDREYNESKSRGQLYCYGGIVIDGGDNKTNQTNMELKLTDEAFIDFLRFTGAGQDANKSDWTRLVQEILDGKSSNRGLFDINPMAINTYLLNRNKKYFSILESKKDRAGANNIYIPCEYYEYLKKIFEANKDNNLLKHNYTALLNIIIYEYLMEMTGKIYIIA